jgi:hypothetical protein
MKKGGHVRRRYYEEMVKDEGEFCKTCNRRPPEVYLEIHHKDGNIHNNTRSNRQFQCRPDNRKLDPRGKGKRKPLRRITDLSEPVISSAEFKKSKECKPIFQHWLYDRIRKKGQELLREVINAGAKKSNASQAAVRRWLEAEASTEGEYIVFYDDVAGEKFVKFREGITIGISADLLGKDQ